MLHYTAKQIERAAGLGDEYVLSDELPDRSGDVIVASGWVLEGSTWPALFNHHRDQIVGMWENVRVVGKRLIGRLRLFEEGTSQTADAVRKMMSQGALETVSIGMLPIKKEPINSRALDEIFGPFRYLKSELLEASLVTVPANPRARRIAKELGFSDAEADRLLAKPGHVQRSIRAAAPSASSPPRPQDPGRRPMAPTLAQQIQQFEHRIVAVQEEIDRLGPADGGEPSDEDHERLDVLKAEKQRAEKNLAWWKAKEATVATRSSIVIPGAGPGLAAPAIMQKKLEPHDYLVRLYAAQFLSRVTGKSIEAVTAERYNDDITREVIKAAVQPASTTVAGWASELVGQSIADFLDLLKAVSIYPQLAAVGPKFTFGRNGIIKVPARSATPKINGSFVGEGQPIPVRRLGLNAISLTPKKMAVISEFTREMALHSTPSIESVVRQAMNDDTADAIDAVLLDAVAADAIRPAGLRNGVAALTATAVGTLTQLQVMVADLKQLINAIVGARGGRSLVLLVNPAQALALEWVMTPNGQFVFESVSAGKVRSLKVISSANVTAGMVIMVDAADFASATGDVPEFDVSDVATIHEEDTTPLAIGTAGAPATIAAPTRSLWQTASIGVRMILEMNWAMRRTGMVSWINAVNW